MARWRRQCGHGPLRRSRDDRLLAGVAAGLADRIGFDVTVVRIGLVLFGLASGFGLAAYVLAWLLVPVEGDPAAIGSRALGDRRGIAIAVGFVPLLIISLLLGSALHAGWLSSVAWPLFISAAGLVLVWRNAPEDERAILRRVALPLIQLGGSSNRSWTGLAVRVAVGVVLAAVGLFGFMVGHGNSVWHPIGGVALVAAGFVVVFGPWWLRLVRELVGERQARVRAEERANIAARVHDSVLQTLAMIQRKADQPQQVVQLARAQERELRAWLFEGRMPGSVADEESQLSGAIRRLEQEVEAAHGVPVEAVVVGDCALTDDLRALLAAGKEATVNAAKWSGARSVSLFAEVEARGVSIFVRDRGRGFDPAAVAADRHGLGESIQGRMTRHGGTAVIRSAIGQGTEVELRMPLPAATGHPWSGAVSG